MSNPSMTYRLRAQAAAALVAVTVAVGAQAADITLRADLVLTGGRILSLDKRSTIAEAVAVRGGRILAVGSASEIQTLVGPNTDVRALNGSTVIPGLNDTHTHFRSAGEALYTVNLRDAKTVDEALEEVRKFASGKKPGQWIVGSAWHPPSQLAEKRYLTRAELDRVAPDQPVYLPTVGHFAMTNSRGLAAAGIDPSTPNPDGGRIERAADGEATGVLIGPAIALLTRVVPGWTFEERAGQYRAAMRILNGFGLTSTVDGGLESTDVRVLRHLADRRESTLRVGVMYRPSYSPAKDIDRWEDWMRGNGAASGFGDEWVRFAGVKLGLDGGMTLRTAHTREPYPDNAHYHGESYMSPEQFRKLVDISDRHGWRVGVHVVGDKATDVALDAFEALNAERPIVGKRFVLIHASLIQRDQVERAKRLGLRVDVQNIFMWDKAATVERFLTRSTADRAVPTRMLIDLLGIDNVGAGTDFPVNVINPFLNMYVMVSRRDPRGVVYGKDQAVTREEALRLYTTSAAHYTFEEDVKGSIEPGKLADLVVLSGDPLTVPEETIKDLKVVTTIVGGRIVHPQPAR